MENIKEYIKKSYSNSIDCGIIKEQYYSDLLYFFNNDIPQEIIEKFLNGEYVDYLYENLFVHDIKKLQNKLKKEYQDFEFKDYESGSFYIITSKVYDLKNNEEFKNLLDFYGYYLSKDDWTFGEQKGKLFIEPKETEDKTDYVYGKCHGVCYHICIENNINSILKSGLRCKKAIYRKYPERVFVYATPENINKDNDFNEIVKELKNPFKKYKQICLKIDLNKLHNSNIKFMKDSAMKYKGALYTYNNIPPQCISIYKKFD